MSRPPSQQWGHPTPDRPYLDPASRSHPSGPMPMPYQPYPPHEPRHFGQLAFDRPVLASPPGPRLPAPGQFADPGADPRYLLASDNAYMARPAMPPQSLPLRSHHRGGAPADPRTYSGQLDDGWSSLFGHGRGYDAPPGRTHSSSSTTIPSPVHSETSAAAAAYARNPAAPSTPQDPPTPKTRTASSRVPHGFDKLLHHDSDSLPALSPRPPPRRSAPEDRYRLHVRQQPLAARACGAGDRDRRPVDPPPIVQILLEDFDSHSQDDHDLLQNPRLTVGCLLFPVEASSPWSQPSDADPRDPDDAFSTPLLSGKAFMSPFFVDADPDPNSAPIHPVSGADDPASPAGQPPSYPHPKRASLLHQPATFFIFADLSIRSAGLYRLQFRLMDWGSVEDTGHEMPILSEAWSDPFRVYPAKDFPGLQDSSILAEGLKELGFVELKTRGKGKGKGRKRW
ncbi:hypothetical protein NUU61_002568 [Penicillium alfredii]|uniref:Velvet domain-containing protein n=1 Tax=Penicillium alfredii TaxID=1506179 RepID=A0A9W9FRQ7_9EURO|nr:uncharacterized protein NUU61_002568 [Penicillium alfredii]KAJ5105221.1 hypothetical protein NUU61_002568 [Penicillium alfredii]